MIEHGGLSLKSYSNQDLDAQSIFFCLIIL